MTDMRAFNTSGQVLVTSQGVVGAYEWATVKKTDAAVAAALSAGTLIPEPAPEPKRSTSNTEPEA